MPGPAVPAEVASPPWLAPYAERLAALDPLAPDARVARLDAWAREAEIATASGRRVRFVPGGAGSGSPAPGAGAARLAYEARIHATGEVPTRVHGAGARHDLLNALAWLVWPITKARLNALHVAEITRAGPGAPRGPLRDALTLFDENAAVWVGTDASLEAALRGFEWRRLFVDERDRVSRSVRVHAFGHALLEKLDAPYKAITAHAWPLRLAADAPLDTVDRALAASIDVDRLDTRAFCPLPVMGLPGWCEANRDPAFLDDPAVFRPGRLHARRQRPSAPS